MKTNRRRDRTSDEWAYVSGVMHYGDAHHVERLGRSRWVAVLPDGSRVVRQTKRAAEQMVRAHVSDLFATTA